MAPKDRTSEFHSTLNSIKSRSALTTNRAKGKQQDREAKQPLISNGPGQTGAKSEFGKMAGGIAKDINSTTLKLQKLAQLAKRKTLFDDRPVEISELTYIIRQDIASLNSQIAQLQAYIKSSKGGKGGSAVSGGKGKGSGGKQEEEHNNNVVMLLQSRLANMGMGFKDVLELRTQNMKASKDRTEQFMHTAQGSSVLAPAENSLLFSQPGDRKGKSRANTPTPNPNSAVSNQGSKRGEKEGQDFLALDIDGDRGESGIGMGGDYQQMQLVEQQDTYIQSRSSAIESIESTIAELGNIFSQLATMVAEQRETVQRIDADTTDIAANVSGAQRELLKYYASVSSNRWLMLKIFGVLIIFFLVFILVS
ncbi:syntaxin 5 [Cryptococcus gattii Ru294]|uniref:Integral membrane protein sed5, putative n=2 Tax=Cryptococcus gattii TaxID=37769 RepID=E6RCI4_CRYGW|nr:integral membrane protein sed5, putative [Cryptococcus gattii WM276]KIR52705.1 syntaxin 5 [Cryptococcus gattii Ru294]KIR80284.1 syntaxin 5 [Cryptococcus gattii EJB2]KIY31394.1 syntaxin 5 [Cryptococcus gattii E566]KJE01294.1 syntaxin 5 [Cryptococcus gattii NT-10]ADV24543.1 integral membrane protein sed5, putative [Cryptococcus gattii WM276]